MTIVILMALRSSMLPYDLGGWKPESIRATATDFIDAILSGGSTRHQCQHV